MSPNQKFAVALTLIAVFVCCMLCPSFWLANKAMSSAPATQAPANTQPAPQPTEFMAPAASPTPIVLTSTEATSQGCGKSWIGDCMGPEMSFPGTATNGIAEIGNPDQNFCALVRVNAGEVLSWNSFGAYWLTTAGQEAVIAQWPHHLKRWQAKPENRDCEVYSSVAEFLLVNPTYR